MKPASSTPTAILLIDIQKAFQHPTQWGLERSTPDFENNIANIIQAARVYNNGLTEPLSGPVINPIHIIHIHHHSSSPDSALHPSAKVPGTDSPGIEPLDCAAPLHTEPVVIKNVNSAFIGTNLEARLRALKVRQLIIAGLTTDHCVSTTTRMAANLHVLGEEAGTDGNGIFVIQDGTATFAKGGFDAETIHAVNLASLNGEFASIITTKSAMKALF
ncbi:isochorismatase hydrolase [Trichoderma gamsii]|uniref:Isochorismatase hydrolase n=1 Tax=Trichoderma gamsii TaxID=398673 RepID=A0A2P4Z767_9HYPO|nr:isochorismatase hydrolase [Trichoderma gamsii]PON20123.1 isochorismatase hydrolase [Trichoderma gamsii]